MKKSIAILAALAVSLVLFTSAKPKNQRQVVYQTSIDCKNCVKKVVENVSFEKGVKDLSTDLEKKTVTVTYDAAKTDTLKLANSIRKLGYKAKVVEDKAL